MQTEGRTDRTHNLTHAFRNFVKAWIKSNLGLQTSVFEHDGPYTHFSTSYSKVVPKEFI